MTRDLADLIASFAAHGRTVAVAESLTGGALTSALIGPAGASAVVRGGIVAYDTELKGSLLGVDPELLDREGPVHPEVAAQMADGVRVALATSSGPASVGVATTGVAGPASQGGRPPGTVFVAVSSEAGLTVHGELLTGDRSSIRAATVELAIHLLRALDAPGNTPR
jgi:nicotinamide-nucleotide amidase